MENTMDKNCVNCLHTRCLFHGENRPPVYDGQGYTRFNCWDNAQAKLSKQNADPDVD